MSPVIDASEDVEIRVYCVSEKEVQQQHIESACIHTSAVSTQVLLSSKQIQVVLAMHVQHWEMMLNNTTLELSAPTRLVYSRP